MNGQSSFSFPQTIPINLYFFHLLIVLLFFILLLILFGLLCFLLYFFEQGMVIFVQVKPIPILLCEEQGINIVLGRTAGCHTFQTVPIAKPKHLLAAID